MAFFLCKKGKTKRVKKKNQTYKSLPNETKTRSNLFLTMITTYGIKKNEYYLGRVHAEVVMEDLFK
jgi:hypothetical protein